MRIGGCLLLVGVVLSVSLGAAFPAPQGYVNDGANVLDPATRAALIVRLREVERQTTAEIAVATVPSLDGLSVEEYANRLFHAWGIGKRGRNNGVLILIAPAERKMRIEVGYGLEPILPDGLAGEIVRTSFLPRFKTGDYRRGITEGVDRVASVVLGNHVVTANERQRLAQGDRAPAAFVVPFFAAFVAIGFFAIGLGVRIKTFGVVGFGILFGGFAILMAQVPVFNAWPIVQDALAIVMFAVGYRKGARPDWIARYRTASATGEPFQWIGMPATSDGGSVGGSSGGDSFGGGDSGGGGASGSW